MKTIIVRNSGDLTTVLRVLKGIHKRLPEMTSKAMMLWGKTLERDIKTSAKGADIRPFKGKLYGKGIEWRQKPKGRIGHLFIRLYGIYLDSMKPHWVSVHRRRTRLLAWAKQANNPKIVAKARLLEARGIKSFSIFVHKHPYIRRGWNRARPKLRPILKSQLKITTL